jgi:hypothetical protein
MPAGLGGILTGLNSGAFATDAPLTPSRWKLALSRPTKGSVCRCK